MITKSGDVHGVETPAIVSMDSKNKPVCDDDLKSRLIKILL